ncbi:MAG: 3-phosphoshikimate 1-carboxyvinyltransferase [Actinomycetes bacterium]|jgi:3-phosphoshikimate 1-carboxyvinyltransferase
MAPNQWAAPHTTRPVVGTVTVPGSKSINNRALILAALSQRPSVLSNVLTARDSLLMIDGLRALGVAIDYLDTTTVRVTPGPLSGPVAVDCGLSGTMMRFIPPLATLAIGDVAFDGDLAARKRPMEPMVTALRKLGAPVSDGGGRSLPFTIHATGHMAGGTIKIDASASSQFVSGLLLSGAMFDNGLTLRHVGSTLPSLPHIDMTVAMLTRAGARITADVSDNTDATWSVANGPIDQGDLLIEPDLSNASAFLAAAMVTGGRVTIPMWPRETTQAGDHIRAIFTDMGGACEFGATGLTVTGPQRPTGIEVDMRDIGELTPTVAAVAAVASEPSHLCGIGHLRGHETDRLAALVTEINRLGGRASETDDGIHIEPRPLVGDVVRTYEDHRMATFGAIVGLVVPDVSVRDIEATGKTIVDFPHLWTSLVSASADDEGSPRV